MLTDARSFQRFLTLEGGPQGWRVIQTSANPAEHEKILSSWLEAQEALALRDRLRLELDQERAA